MIVRHGFFHFLPWIERFGMYLRHTLRPRLDVPKAYTPARLDVPKAYTVYK